MIVKLTSRDGGVQLLDNVRSCIFHTRDDAPGRWALMTMEDGSSKHVLLEGWTYVMTDEGVTVEKVSLLTAQK